MLLALFLLFLTVLPVHAVTRYMSTTGLDTNSCSASTNTATPKRNFSSALPCMAAGDILYLRGGTYGRLNQADQAFPRGTSWSNPTTIAGYPGETAIISTGAVVALDIGPNSGAKDLYIIIRDLVVDGQNSTGGGIWVGANRVRLLNIDNRKYYQNGLQIGGDFNEFINLKVHDNLNGQPRNHGFYMWGSDNIIDNCEVYDNNGLGMQIYGGGTENTVDRNIVKNSSVHHNGSSTNSSGILLGYGTGNIAYNNLVYNNTQASHGIILDYGCINCLVYNNTIVGNVNAGLAVGPSSHNGISTGSIFRNNIVHNNAGGGAQVSMAAGTTATFSNNLCSVAGTGCQYVGNPQFQNAGSFDFRLTASSPAKDQGTVIAMVNVDRIGTVRPQPAGGAYDIGAYELVQGGGPPPPTANDVYVRKTGSSDSNDCLAAENTSTPKLTITSAVGCLTTPGKRVVILDTSAVYDEAIDTNIIAIANGNDAADPTTIMGAVGSNITIRAPAVDTTVIFLRNSNQHLLFQNLHIDCNSLAGTNALAMYSGVGNIKLDSVELHHCDYEGLFISGASNITVTNSSIHHNTFHGITLEGAVNGFTLSKSDVNNNDGAGVQLRGGGAGGTSQNVVIDKCKIHHNGAGMSSAALDIGNSLGVAIKSSLIYRNYAGVLLQTTTDNVNTMNATIAHNTNAAFSCPVEVTPAALVNTIVFGNGSAITDNCSLDVRGTITADPLFTNSAGDIYTLTTGSPAFNAGADFPVVVDDILDVSRPQFGLYDAGAYESTVDLGQTAPSLGTFVVRDLPEQSRFWF